MHSYRQDFARLKGLRCTVLGANGFIGTNLCLALAAAGVRVKGCGRSLAARPELKGKIEWVQVELTVDESLHQAVEGADVVVHLVSTLLPAASNIEKIRDVEENLISTLRLLESCKKTGVKKFIFASSGGTIYGAQPITPISEEKLTNPICSYGIIKVAVENYLNLYRHLYSLDFVALRIANPFGQYQMPHDQGLVAALIGKALKETTIDIWGNGSVVRDYIHISDLVDAIILAIFLNEAAAPRIYNIGSGVGRSVNDVLNAVETIHGKSLNVRYHPERSVDVPINVLDIKLARDYLGWSPNAEWIHSLENTYRWLHDVYI